ncbi:uncharacterized protein [Prorops nasuta]|uniref:uncharacterized protein n=1 Tax=Prorops nasuta TaxID=863751 RepID=UPI0034CE462B
MCPRIERIAGGRDIRLSTATMRALNSASPRPVSSVLPVPRLFFLLLLLFACLLSSAQARNVPVDKSFEAEPEGPTVVAEQLKEIPAKPVARVLEEEKSEREKTDAEITEDDTSVAKKRKRTDVSLPGKSDNEEKIGVHGSLVQGVISDGIRRFDAQVEPEYVVDAKTVASESGSSGGGKIVASGSIAGDQQTQKKRFIEDGTVTVEEPKEVIIKADDEEPSLVGNEAKSQLGDRAKEDAEERLKVKQGDVKVQEINEQLDGASRSEEKAQADGAEGIDDRANNNLRNLNEKSESVDDWGSVGDKNVEDGKVNRENRERKTKYKSTVYLNAEEEKNFKGVQEAIVDDQIKKLISIRDDALGSAVIVKDKVQDDARNQRSSYIALDGFNNNVGKARAMSRFESWKEQALALQEQIKNNSFFQQLREQAIEVLPDIPKFNENQLLDTLRFIVNSKKLGPSNVSYVNKLDSNVLSKNQMDIIKCTEQLIDPKQRYDFVSSVTNCIRGLSVWNCLRTYVWPAIMENVSPAIAERLPNFPIEITLSDLFPGNRDKAPKAAFIQARQRLLTPETILLSILKDALDVGFVDNRLPTYIDPRNETLKKLLTPSRIEILQIAEKLLPLTARREYSDKMYSCIQRFEYFSCVKSFAWPLVKQSYPALPPFPEYQNWYPTIAVYPEYPLVPLPNFPEQIGQLPEVIDADDPRLRASRPSTIIVHMLQNTLRQMSKTVPPLSSVKPGYVTVIPHEQLLSIQMAEQFLPAQYRAEFVQKTMQCIRDYDYTTCIKYSTWPTLRQFAPGLPDFPDFSGWIPDFSLPDFSLPDFSDYLPNFSDYIPDFSSFPDISGYIPGFAQETASSAEQTPVEPAASDNSSAIPQQPPSVKKSDDPRDKSTFLETKVKEILTKVQSSVKRTPEVPPVIVSGNVVILTTITEEQVKILRLAENVIPPPERSRFIFQVVSCLQATDDFINCTQYIIWPFLGVYVENLPPFPVSGSQQPQSPEVSTDSSDPDKTNSTSDSIKELYQDNPDFSKPTMKHSIQSRVNEEKISLPVISVTGTRFVPIFTDHPEVVMLNILRSIQLSSPPVNSPVQLSRTPEFNNYLNQQQETIIRITESLIPDNIRPNFVNRMIDCVRENNFLLCSRDVLWPTLTEYFPRIPSFPNFPNLSDTSTRSNVTSSDKPQNLTEPTSPIPDNNILSETNVKTGQHGDATVTITDTRFVPIFSDHPEAVIYNILRAVQLSTPNLPSAEILQKSKEFSNLFTEHQMNIIQVAEALLPENERSDLMKKLMICGSEETFLECSKSIIWPSVTRYYPRLPSFPNFGNTQNIARNRLHSEQALSLETKEADNRVRMENMEVEVEETLKKGLLKHLKTNEKLSYLDTSNPIIAALLTSRQADIIKLAESGMPDEIRPTFITRMMICIQVNNFIGCTQNLSWPTLKQFIPEFPDFPDFRDYHPELPNLPQTPDFGGLLPTVLQFPQLPGSFGDLTQFPAYPEIPNFPKFGGSLKTSQKMAVPQPSVPVPQPAIPEHQSQAQTRSEVKVNPNANAQSQSETKIEAAPDQAQSEVKVEAETRANAQFQGKVDVESKAQAKSEMKVEAQAQVEEKVDLGTRALSQAQAQNLQTKIGPASSIPAQHVGTSANTPSVGNQGAIPGYPGQPEGIFIDISRERVSLPEDLQNSLPLKKRSKRDVVNLLNSYPDEGTATEYPYESFETEYPHFTKKFPNFTESEFLQLLVNVSNNRAVGPVNLDREYYVDTLGESFRKTVTADQYEILKRVENLIPEASSRGFLQQVVACIRSLSFIRCIGIFVWPMISSNLPSLNPFGRSMEDGVQQYFGMTTTEFEAELLARKRSIEYSLIDWYKSLSENKFQKDIGFVRIKGYGNGEIGIRILKKRSARASKIKDNKNLPSILTIISDIMEEVLDQRPDHDRKKDKDKRVKSIEDPHVSSDYQSLKETDKKVSYDIERSNNDDKIINMFIEKIKTNASDYADGDVKQYLSSNDPYKAFELLFGPRLNEKFMERLNDLSERHLRSVIKKRPEDYKEINILPLEAQGNDNSKLADETQPLEPKVTYDLEKESSDDGSQQSSARHFQDLIWNKFSNKNNVRDSSEENTISMDDDETSTELSLQLPKLDEDIISRKSTSALIHLGRSMRHKMMQMMPGLGIMASFFVHMALAHARAAANVAGFLSNMALGSAMIGMIRNMMFGPSTHPKIKYVYDNDNMGPGVIWPQGYNGNYYG